MEELINKIKLHTEAGSILEHMELFDEIASLIKEDIFIGTWRGEDVYLSGVSDADTAEVATRLRFEDRELPVGKYEFDEFGKLVKKDEKIKWTWQKGLLPFF